jgi:hypothetical protein
MKTLKRGLTGANRENGGKNLCSLRSLLLNSGRDGDVEVSQFGDEITVNCVPLV